MADFQAKKIGKQNEIFRLETKFLRVGGED